MKLSICVLATVSLVGASALYAQDGDDASALVEASGDGVAAREKAVEPAVFHTLPRCNLFEGVAEVRRPGKTGWEPMEEGLFYPLGSAFRTTGPGSMLELEFGKGLKAVLSADSSVLTRLQGIGEKSRAVILDSGTVTLRLPTNLKDGLFVVSAADYTVYNLHGESRFVYQKTGDGTEGTLRCVTGAFAVKGRHFEIPEMKVQNELRIRSSQDSLFTGLYGKSGDFVVKLDCGRVFVKNYETGEETEENRTLDWHMSPRTAAKIYRAKPAVGERMSVSILTFDAAGLLKNRCAYSENRSEINSGELVVNINEADKENLAKKAAAVTETVSESDEDDGGESSTDGSGENAEAEPAAEVSDDEF